jgi:hypothetical protein
MSNRENIIRIQAVNQALGELREKVVFVGGATISLYADRQIFEVRPTDDVDIIVEILNYSQRAELEEKLRSLGFNHAIHSPVVCRFMIQGITVDIMPTNDPSIGFVNRWYPEGFTRAIHHRFDENNNSIKILSAPYFIATKMEAFKSRGKGNGRMSHDFEDIVYVLENRESVWNELNSLNGAIKEYLVQEFAELLKNRNLFDWIDGHVERGSPPATSHIIGQLENFCINNDKKISRKR